MPQDIPLLSRFARAPLLTAPSPLERMDRLSERLGIDLWLKRDDLTSISFGGNKVRQLEYYFGDAQAQGADTILITGAVQSNFVRSAATVAAMLGMEAIVQLEERVDNVSPGYRTSGNVLLEKILGAEQVFYEGPQDEAAADQALQARADALRAAGRMPYVIHLGVGHPPLGALGYVRAGFELVAQMEDFDVAVVPSGSGATHGGFLTGLHLAGSGAAVHGMCVRRDAALQTARIDRVTSDLAGLMEIERPFEKAAIRLFDGAFGPGYGQVTGEIRDAIRMMARMEGIFLDPVYSGKTFAGLLDQLAQGEIDKGQKVVMLHTGGLPALFAYEAELGEG